MNINNKSLEILLDSYIGENIKAQLNGYGKKVDFYWHELLTELVIKHDKKYYYVHYIYNSVYKNIDFEGQVIDSPEIIEFTLSNTTDDSKENLERLEKEYRIDKNCLYYIINILKEREM